MFDKAEQNILGQRTCRMDTMLVVLEHALELR